MGLPGKMSPTAEKQYLESIWKYLGSLIKRMVQILKYWIRLLSLPQGHILQHCYQTLLALPSATSNWVTYVKELLSIAWATYIVNFGSSKLIT